MSLMRMCVVACILTCFAPATALRAYAQANFEVSPTAVIPRDGYESWSLFLICSPDWILQNGNTGVTELFREYQAFGRSIGPKNLAIWFWKKPGQPTLDNTDVEGSSAYCGKFGLLPSESPHVLVTTHYPDDAEPGDRFIVRLNGEDAHDSALALTKLADQLVVTGLNQPGLDASDRWRRILAGVGSAISAASCYFSKVSFSLKTGVLNADIEHSTSGGHC